jgi:hypothetical protein
MKEITDRKSRGREAPMVITPWAVARLVKQIAGAVRGATSRRRRPS